jgi:hypothetical protein
MSKSISRAKKYRKKPVVIEAIQWKPYEMLIKDVMDFMGISGGMMKKGVLSIGKRKGELIIKTLEGNMTVSDGDYIIKGVKGEFYPCKPDIFDKTYELVEGEAFVQ